MKNSAFCRYFGAFSAGISFLLFGGTLAHAQNDIFYVSDTSAGTVSEINSSRNESIIASGLNSPEGLAIDSSGNVYVANSGNGTISEINSAGNVSTFASGFTDPQGLTFDPSGNLYVYNPSYSYGNYGTISKITSSGNVSVFATGIASTIDGAFLASDNAGNIYANTVFTIQQIDSSGNLSTAFNVNPNNPSGVAVDSAGNLYVAVQNSDGVVCSGNTSLDLKGNDYPAPFGGGGEFTAFEDPPEDLAFDTNGNLFASFSEMNNTQSESYDYVSDDLIEFGANGVNSVIATDMGGTYFAVESIPEPAILTLVSGLAAVWYIRRRSAVTRPFSPALAS